MKSKDLKDFVSEKMVSGQTDKMFVLGTVINDYLNRVVPLLYNDETLLPIFDDIAKVQENLTNLKASL